MSLFFRLKVRHILEKEAHLQHERTLICEFSRKGPDYFYFVYFLKITKLES